MNSSDSRGQELISRPLAGSADDADVVSALLSELQSGFPIGELKKLLRADTDEAVQVGVWLASEMGEAANELLNDVVPLLSHQSEKVRFYAVDFLGASVRRSNWEAASVVVRMVDDPAAAVRYVVTKFLFDVPEDVLRRTRDAAVKAPGSSAQARGLSLLIDAVDGCDTGRIQAALDDPDPITRRFAAAAAARLSSHDPTLLARAAIVEDPDVRKFATNTIRRIGARRRSLH